MLWDLKLSDLETALNTDNLFTSDLIVSPPETLVSSVMIPDPVSVHVLDDEDAVAEVVAHYNLLAVPVTDSDGRLEGIVTDGDLRRHLRRGSNVLEHTARDVMTQQPVTIGRQHLAVEALRLMEERKITSLVVVNSGGDLEGIVHLHDLWGTEMV